MKLKLDHLKRRSEIAEACNNHKHLLMWWSLVSQLHCSIPSFKLTCFCLIILGRCNISLLNVPCALLLAGFVGTWSKLEHQLRMHGIDYEGYRSMRVFVGPELPLVTLAAVRLC